MSVTARFNLVDVFTDTPLQGNQLGVFTDARALSADQMQALAAELGFSECVFVLPPQGEGHARIRIFTPVTELPFAGHPTLGAAWVLAAPMQLTRIVLETAAGEVPVTVEREGAKLLFGRMEQPLPSVEPFAHDAELFAALGVAGSELPVEIYDNGMPHVLVALSSVDDVAGLGPDFRALASMGYLGVSCFAQLAGEGARVKTRMFAPADGVDEDPATGSAAGPLAVHLARYGMVPWGTEIAISQGTEIGRPSMLFATAHGSDGTGATRVEVGGTAVVVGRGEFVVG